MALFVNMTIRRKLTLIIMLISSIALLLACVAFITYDRITFKSTMTQKVRILAEVIGNNSTAALTFDNRSDAQETLSALKVEPHIVAATIYSRDGNVFVTYLADRGRSSSLPPLPCRVGRLSPRTTSSCSIRSSWTMNRSARSTCDRIFRSFIRA